MGLAIIIPKVSFADANLGKVTLSGDVPLQGLHIKLDDSYESSTVDLQASFLPINTTQRDVTWLIEDGTEYASVSGSVLTIKVGASNNDVILKCISNSTPSISDQKTIKVTYKEASVIRNPQLYFPLTTDGVDRITGLSPEVFYNINYTKDGVLVNGSINNSGLFYNINNVAYRSVLFDMKYFNGSIASTYPYMFSLSYLLSNTNRNASGLYYDTSSYRKLGYTMYMSNSNQDTRIDSTFVVEQWNKIAVVTDGVTTKIYVNGSLAKTIEGSNLSIFPQCKKLIIGNVADGNRSFNGYLKNFYFFLRALTDTEAANYTTL